MRRKSGRGSQTFCILFLLLFCESVLSQKEDHRHEDDKTSSNDDDPSFSSTPSPSVITQVSYFDCLPSCECDYTKKPSQRLEINCQSQSLSTTNSNNGSIVTHNVTSLHLEDGVRQLILRNTNLTSNLKFLFPTLTPNTLTSLELHNVTLNPADLFNSHLLNESRDSLQSISIFQSSVIVTTTEIYEEDYDYTKELSAFSSLRNLDNLTVCDSNPVLSQMILQALPTSVLNIEVINSSMSSIYYYSFSRVFGLQSLNLSQNHLTTIPNYLFNNLQNLTSLDFSNNHLTHLQEDVFEGLGSLQTLDLSHNFIEYVDAEVFTHVSDLQVIDLSNNEVIQFFEPYFRHNKNLRMINMSNAWVSKTFINTETAARSYREMDGLISTLGKGVEELDLSDNQMTIIPETLSHVPHLKRVNLNGNPWTCSCDDRWLLYWLASSNVSLGKEESNVEGTFCHNTTDATNYPLVPYIDNLSQNCSGGIAARYLSKYFALMETEKVLTCHPRIGLEPKITWITPSKKEITFNSSINFTSLNFPFDGENEEDISPTLFPDGALLIHNIHPKDYGRYVCIASYDDLNVTHYVHLGMDVSIFRDVKLMSIIVGLISSFGFLFLVLLGQLIRYLLMKSGLKCIAVRTAKQTRRVRAFFDTMEQNKNTQLAWLRQNYQMQAKKIQDNCISQLERIRDSYTTQTKNLSGIRDYSAQQLSTVRDQYQDQIRKVASYSAHRLGKVRENYVFNRNRVGKFSSHQFIRLREVYKWQAQQVSKILENLPQGLNLDSCRGVGVCGRADSVYFDDFNESPIDLTDEIVKAGTSKDHISLLIPPEFLESFMTRANEPLRLLREPDEETMLLEEASSSFSSSSNSRNHNSTSASDEVRTEETICTCSTSHYDDQSHIPFVDDEV